MSESATATELSSRLSRVHLRHVDQVLHLTFPSGQADGRAVRELYEVASVMVTSSRVKLLVDFSDVPLVNSGAMGMMVTLKKRCMAEGAQFHIVIPNDMIREQFALMNLHRILNIFPGLDDAMKRFKA